MNVRQLSNTRGERANEPADKISKDAWIGLKNDAELQRSSFRPRQTEYLTLFAKFQHSTGSTTNARLSASKEAHE
jgi:hypothetical protein